MIKIKMTVNINPRRCTGCSQCIVVCPEEILVMMQGYVQVTKELCMTCGHCQAVCPEDAIVIDDLGYALGLKNVKDENRYLPPGRGDISELVQLMRSRRSCRSYLPKPVELTILEDLVKIGTSAPSGTNSQSWSFVILPNRREVDVFGNGVATFYRQLNKKAANPLIRIIARLLGQRGLKRYYERYYSSIEQAIKEWDEMGIDRLFHGATAVIVVLGDKSASCPAEDALLASQNILLAAHAMGLGSCLVGFAVEAVRRKSDLKRMLKMTAEEEVYAVIGLGYPNQTYCKPAGRKSVTPRVLKKIDGKMRVYTRDENVSPKN